METTARGSYLSRLALSFIASFGLVFLATVAVGGHGHDWISLSVGAIFTLLFALVAAALASLVVRRGGIALVLWAQALTVVAIGIFNVSA